MNHQKIILIACMLSGNIFEISKPIITICNKSTLLAFVELINKIPGKIDSRDFAFLEYFIKSNFRHGL